MHVRACVIILVAVVGYYVFCNIPKYLGSTYDRRIDGSGCRETDYTTFGLFPSKKDRVAPLGRGRGAGATYSLRRDGSQGI